MDDGRSLKDVIIWVILVFFLPWQDSLFHHILVILLDAGLACHVDSHIANNLIVLTDDSDGWDFLFSVPASRGHENIVLIGLIFDNIGVASGCHDLRFLRFDSAGETSKLGRSLAIGSKLRFLLDKLPFRLSCVILPLTLPWALVLLFHDLGELHCLHSLTFLLMLLQFQHL